MRRSVRRAIASAALAACLLVLLSTNAAGQGQACAPAVVDEFLRQQAVVEWTVYCPTYLPADLTISRVDGSMDPGGGLFIVTLTSPAGAELVITQGAGASIFHRRAPDGSAEEPAGDAAYGDLAGKLYTSEPAAVIAYDDAGFGHAIQSSGIGVEALLQIAAGTRPVSEAAPAPQAVPATGTGFGVSQHATRAVVALAALGVALVGAASVSLSVLTPRRRRGGSSGGGGSRRTGSGRRRPSPAC